MVNLGNLGVRSFGVSFCLFVCTYKVVYTFSVIKILFLHTFVGLVHMLVITPFVLIVLLVLLIRFLVVRMLLFVSSLALLT